MVVLSIVAGVWRPDHASVDDCVCAKELAAHLIQTLFAGNEPEEAASDKLFVLIPEGNRAAVSLSELQAR